MPIFILFIFVFLGWLLIGFLFAMAEEENSSGTAIFGCIIACLWFSSIFWFYKYCQQDLVVTNTSYFNTIEIDDNLYIIDKNTHLDAVNGLISVESAYKRGDNPEDFVIEKQEYQQWYLGIHSMKTPEYVKVEKSKLKPEQLENIVTYE